MTAKGKYLRRVVDDYYDMRLGATGALLIEGPKWCGKTRTAERMAKSALYCQDPDERAYIEHQAGTKPSVLLEGEKPRLIDEWQVIPVIWDAVRYAVDRSGERRGFILTGSAVPNIDTEAASKMHSGTGRIAPVRMRTMSLFESGDSNGSVSLRSLFEGIIPEGRSDMTVERLAYVLCRGGWPSTVGMAKEPSLQVAKDYCEAIAREDCIRADGVRRDYFVMKGIMRSLGRLTCQLAGNETIALDLKENEKVTVKTVADYVGILRMLYVLEDVPSWVPSMIAKSRIRKAQKRCFVDPSIAAAVIGAGPGALIGDSAMFGRLFECMCIRDLRVYSQPLGGTVYHYHDETNLKVDAVVELEDGRWAAFEVKLSSVLEDQAAKNLMRLRKKVANPPEFMAVITGTGFAHVRDDGIFVIPIGCLRD